MLVKPFTSEVRMALCPSLDLVGTACSYRGGFWKYWFNVHFYRPIPSYHFEPTFLSSKEVNMKEDLHAWYQGLEYEEGFGPGKILSFQ